MKEIEELETMIKADVFNTNEILNKLGEIAKILEGKEMNIEDKKYLIHNQEIVIRDLRRLLDLYRNMIKTITDIEV